MLALFLTSKLGGIVKARMFIAALSALTLGCSLLTGAAASPNQVLSEVRFDPQATDRGDLSERAERVRQLLQTSPNAQRSFTALSDRDREAFALRFLPSETRTTVVLTALPVPHTEVPPAVRTFDTVAEAMATVAASKKCYAGFAKFTAVAALGYALWDTFTEGKFCGNGARVTSATFNRSWSSISSLGWRDTGQIGKGAGVVNGQARIWSQRRMVFGAGGWDLQTWQPCVRINGKANGSAKTNFVCSIYG